MNINIPLLFSQTIQDTENDMVSNLLIKCNIFKSKSKPKQIQVLKIKFVKYLLTKDFIGYNFIATFLKDGRFNDVLTWNKRYIKRYGK